MKEAETTFNRIAETLSEQHEGISRAKAFGMPALKLNRKMFGGFFEGDMTFKLTGEDHRGALALSGSRLFDPSGNGRPMKEWVQVSFEHHDRWLYLAEAALRYVETGI